MNTWGFGINDAYGICKWQHRCVSTLKQRTERLKGHTTSQQGPCQSLYDMSDARTGTWLNCKGKEMKPSAPVDSRQHVPHGYAGPVPAAHGSQHDTRTSSVLHVFLTFLHSSNKISYYALLPSRKQDQYMSTGVEAPCYYMQICFCS